MIAEFIKKRQFVGELKKAFSVAGLYREYYSYNSNKVRIYPKIHSAREIDDKIEYVFTLPNGMDPKDVAKKEYVFRQVFGNNIELNGDLKKYVLTIYQTYMPKEIRYNPLYITPIVREYKLPIICGVDVHGEYVSYDMVDYPHLLIAGETGSGKSTQVRSIITTLIRNVNADRLHLYMADLKRSEFHVFKRVKHVKSVMTRTSELKRKLSELKAELEYRGDLLDEHEATHIDDLSEKKPYIVLCIDEVALLKKEKDIMEIVEEISAIGRALGVFLILSMQRPDRDVLDGKLKNNLTVRMAFRHSDGINSRITIGTQNARDIGIDERGRMYLKLEQLTLLQAPYLDVTEARKLLDPYRMARTETKEVTVSVPKTSIVSEPTQTAPIQLDLLGGDDE